ncbi:uncharacterized protein BDZ99DRAFT_496348, partial [Mytilinidion resinicola]
MDVSTIVRSSSTLVQTTVLAAAMTAMSGIAVVVDRMVFGRPRARADFQRLEEHYRNVAPHETIDRSIAERCYTDGQGETHRVPFPYELILNPKVSPAQRSSIRARMLILYLTVHTFGASERIGYPTSSKGYSNARRALTRSGGAK